MRTACALEMIHCYSLVHDDLPAMDDDDLRRGRPTAHKAFDEATAILAGDGLLTYAFDVLADPATHADPAVRAALVLALARAAGLGGMVGGQALDLAAETAGRPLAQDEILTLQAMKTGALLRFAVDAGAILGESRRRDRRGRCRAMARRSARPFRSPTIFSTRPATRRRSASAPARTPNAARRRWSDCWGWTPPAPAAIRWSKRRSPRSTRRD